MESQRGEKYIFEKSNVFGLILKNRIISGAYIIFLLACTGNRKLPISSILPELKSSDKVERSYFFYPSILRIFNLKAHPDYYDLIRNIKKLGVYRMSDEFSSDDVESLRLRLLEEEHFEEYARLNIKGQRIYFLGKEEPNYAILMIPSQEEFYIADIEGQINFWSLNKLVQSMVSDSSSTGDDFLDVLSLIGLERRKEEIITDSLSVDSVRPDADSGSLITK